MGNCASSTSTAKLVDSDGNLRRVKLPVKAAELMLESPGHAVAAADGLRSSRRVTALRADDDLVRGKLYLLISLNRINSKVSDSEIAAVTKFSEKRKAISGRRSRSKVSPAAEAARDLAVIGGGEEEEENRFGAVKIENQYRRQWNPVLEPIIEY